MRAPSWVALVCYLCSAALAEARSRERPSAPGLPTPSSQRAPHFTDGPVHGSTGPCGILVHGCHIQADAWESIMWGDIGTQQLGRIPRAILTAREQNAEIGAARATAAGTTVATITTRHHHHHTPHAARRATPCVPPTVLHPRPPVIFGTGGSEDSRGRKEGAVILEYMLTNFNRLSAFEAFNGMDLHALKARMVEIAMAETESLNTLEELQCAASLFEQRSIRCSKRRRSLSPPTSTCNSQRLPTPP